MVCCFNRHLHYHVKSIFLRYFLALRLFSCMRFCHFIKIFIIINVIQMHNNILIQELALTVGLLFEFCDNCSHSLFAINCIACFICDIVSIALYMKTSRQFRACSHAEAIIRFFFFFFFCSIHVMFYNSFFCSEHGRQLRLYDIRSREREIHTFGWKQSSESKSGLISQSWSHDGWHLSSGSLDPAIHLFDIRCNGKGPSQTIHAHQRRVFKAIWHQSIPLMTSVSSDHNIGLHEME